MRAMLLEKIGGPLVLRDIARPRPGPFEVLVEVSKCGVCRTDLHVIDGDISRPKLPLVLGHEIVGRIAALGPGVEGLSLGLRIGVPWLGGCCGTCRWCISGRENLCDEARYTGYQIDGGFAEFAVCDRRFALPLPRQYSDEKAAPLLCAGLIGFRALRMAAEARRIGLYGFGASAHIICQVAAHEGREVFAFTRPGDRQKQELALSLGALWAGGSDERAPKLLDAALIFAPVGALVPAALKSLDKGGIVVCAGIHMSDIPSFAYSLLWEERRIKSVANLTRDDGLEFMKTAAGFALRVETELFKLEEANEAVLRLREGRVRGAAVLDLE